MLDSQDVGVFENGKSFDLQHHPTVFIHILHCIQDIGYPMAKSNSQRIHDEVNVEKESDPDLKQVPQLKFENKSENSSFSDWEDFTRTIREVSTLLEGGITEADFHHEYENRRLRMNHFIRNLQDPEKIREAKEAEIKAKLTDIRQLIKEWETINDCFIGFVAINDQLKKESIDGKLIKTIDEFMEKQGEVIVTFHELLLPKISTILESKECVLDMLMFGGNSTAKLNVVLALQEMQSIPFWTLTEGNISKSLEQLKPTMKRIIEALEEFPHNAECPTLDNEKSKSENK